MNKLEKAKQRGKAFFDTIYPEFANFFTSQYTILDIGAGNGCCGLYWPNYTHFIDKKKPNTFEKLNSEFQKQNFEYHIMNFEIFPTDNIEGDKALTGIHTCRELTDLIISRAIQERVPLAVVPCCHPRDYEAMPDTPYFGKYSKYVDDSRTVWLKESGFTCQTRKIPNLGSPMNTVIIGFPD